MGYSSPSKEARFRSAALQKADRIGFQLLNPEAGRRFGQCPDPNRIRMLPEQFFELFLAELASTPALQGYYKFLASSASREFRKNYFLQRLNYIYKHIKGGQDTLVLDVGCGFGTTCLFLAMNGIRTEGITLEFYYEKIAGRKEYWQQFGESSLFSCSYENLFDSPPRPTAFDTILIQDTLHHLEPIDKALKIFNASLKPAGNVLVVEENGNNIIQRLMLYRQRGNNRIMPMWDEKLKKEILIGNENIRSLENWSRLFDASGMEVQTDSVEYIRYYLPFFYRFVSSEVLLKRESVIQKSSPLRREYFFFGLSFMARKKSLQFDKRLC